MVRQFENPPNMLINRTGNGHRRIHEAPPAKRTRPGRPKLAEGDVEHANEADRRKAQVRLAQRLYRTRKEFTLSSAKARAAGLETALEKTHASFQKFHEFVVGLNPGVVPADVILHLGRTAMEISSISNQVRKRADLENSLSETPAESNASLQIKVSTEPLEAAEEVPSQHMAPIVGSTQGRIHVSSTQFSAVDPFERPLTLIPWTANLDKVPLEHRLLRACLERASRLLSQVNGTFGLPLSALSLCLRIDSRDRLLSMAMNALSKPNGHIGDFSYAKPVTRILPRMFRSVEGKPGSISLRLPPPFLQTLEFGQTRTSLATINPKLQGEWLEATDVQEYLEERGICVRDSLNTSPEGLKNVHSMATIRKEQFEVFANAPPSLPQTINPKDGDIPFPGHTSLEANTYAPSIYEQHFNNNEQSHTEWAESGFARPFIDTASDFRIFGQRSETFPQLPSGLYTFTPTPAQHASIEVGQNVYTQYASPPEILAGSHFTSLTINVDKLIEKLALYAVCLGPAPGVRRADVDTAIRESIVGL